MVGPARRRRISKPRVVCGGAKLIFGLLTNLVNYQIDLVITKLWKNDFIYLYLNTIFSLYLNTIYLILWILSCCVGKGFVEVISRETEVAQCSFIFGISFLLLYIEKCYREHSCYLFIVNIFTYILFSPLSTHKRVPVYFHTIGLHMATL